MKKLYCITCPAGCLLSVTDTDSEIVVEGNKCERGVEFANHEMSNPTRTLTTTVRTRFPGVPVISVRTDGEIPRDMLMDAMKELSEVVIETELGVGDIVYEDILNTGVNVIITSPALMKLGAELENKNVELSRRGSSGDSGTEAIAVFSGGVVNAANVGVLNAIGANVTGANSADGFVGAAGEAVGVEGVSDENESDAAEDGKETGRIKIKGRPHIKR